MADLEEKRIVDLSHVIEHGMTTYPGLPGPHLCDFWAREATAANYDDGSTLTFTARCRIDTYNELEYFRSGGILHYVLRKLAAA